MPRLIRFPQTDERPLFVTFDEDSDSWWAGPQRLFSAVPIAATVAAIALSASLAFGYQQHTDEIVPQPAAIAEEEYWQRPTWVDPPVQLLGPAWDDQTFFGVLELEEDVGFQPWTGLAVRPVLQPAWADDDLPVAPAVIALDEDFWWVPTSRAAPASVLLWSIDDELPVAPAAFAPEEDFWLPPILRLAGPAPIAWAVDDDFPGIPPTPLGVDEDYWWTAFSLPGALYAPVLTADDEIVPPPPPTEYALDSGTWAVQRVASGKRAVTVW